MSIDLITMVRRRLDVTHGELLVAVELADAANDYGEGISVGVDRIADRSRQDPRTVQRQLARLREVGWLLIVEEGGMRGGRGKPTHYRINQAWIKGDTLPGFPDFVPKHYHREKGDKLSPITGEHPVDSSGERVTNLDERVTKPPLKGDTAVSPDPSTHIPSGAQERAIPSGSPPAPEKKPTKKSGEEPPAFDEQVSRRYWWTHAVNFTLGSASALALAPFGIQRLDQMPNQVYALMRDVCRQVTDDAIAEERRLYPLKAIDRTRIETDITGRITRDLMAIKAARAAA